MYNQWINLSTIHSSRVEGPRRPKQNSREPRNVGRQSTAQSRQPSSSCRHFVANMGSTCSMCRMFHQSDPREVGSCEPTVTTYWSPRKIDPPKNVKVSHLATAATSIQSKLWNLMLAKSILECEVIYSRSFSQSSWTRISQRDQLAITATSIQSQLACSNRLTQGSRDHLHFRMRREHRHHDVAVVAKELVNAQPVSALPPPANEKVPYLLGRQHGIIDVSRGQSRETISTCVAFHTARRARDLPSSRSSLPSPRQTPTIKLSKDLSNSRQREVSHWQSSNDELNTA